MADKNKADEAQVSEADSNGKAPDGTVDRNKGMGIKGYDEKNPNPADIHSDDPMIAGLANGERQARGEGDEGAPVK